jgi:hypothetical protein
MLLITVSESIQNFDDALRCLKQADDNLEALAGIVQIYLKYDRLDLAKYVCLCRTMTHLFQEGAQAHAGEG